MQASSSTTTTTTTKTKKLSSATGSGGNMVSSVAMSSATKTTTTTTRKQPSASTAGASPKSPKAGATSTNKQNATPKTTATNSHSEPHAEIAELSKMINEHADAIYHTWKSRGLPPAQLLEMYTNAAASGDFANVAGTAADAEGLQQMVTSFVNKDKEQRGKSNSTSTTNGKVKKVAIVAASDQASLQSPKKVAAAVGASKTQPDVNLNYDINLHLDVNNLSHQQTQQLLKIGELIQQQKDKEQKEKDKERETSKATTTGTGTTATVAKKRQIVKNSGNSNNGNSVSNSKITLKENTKQQKPANVSIDVRDAAASRVGVGVAVVEATSVSDKPREVTATSRSGSNSKKTKEHNNNNHIEKPATKEKPATTTTTTNAVRSNSKAAEAVAPSATTTTTATTNRTDNNIINSSNIVANASEMANNTPATPASTTMPTLNKVKPTSGTRSPLTNGQDKNLGRPILTRGSVAERVLMFEKCPDVRNAFHNIKRPQAEAPPKSLLKVKLHATPPPPVEQNLLQKEIRSTKSVYIPRFYFPHGKPQPTIAMERVIRGILSAFDSFPNNQVTKDELPRILKLCGLPFYWRMPVMVFCQTASTGLVERQRFVEFWKQMNVYCHEAASRFVYILSRGQRFRSYIVPEDLVPMVQDVVDTHPGLAFLKEATEFHSRYVHTVIARIFYSVNRSWSGKITIAELKRSDLLEMISLLEEEEDINQIMAFFSYEHFYVIYCKFWELDKDHDLLINQEDLARHSDHALSTRIVERIFSGCVTRSDNKKNPEDEAKMSYTDFVWFILSEEDKRTPTAIEYWFRCMDVDGDGALSMYELEYFYEEQQQRMEGIGIECLPFEDCLCQMLDMIKPANRDCITLSDLKRCKMTHVFFDTFFNLEKYLDHEQRDPFASQRDEYTSDWDRFAAQEYELLISEENE
ncbi:serine/threonine-protein phosphatase 2A regulatory subunit B'' subunit alpha [Drosophila tropicalis]|uniref:serine/threonine-protein phosphatase 2A regulatory subunit B'' subunit alpha n=1 Tax=Drosophila tropicalis TaxID=46794 RepID=UPI0035AC0EB3